MTGRGAFERLSRCGLALTCFCLLAGCVDSYVSASAPRTRATAAANETRRAGVSPGGATVAMASFTGSPDAVTERFRSAFDKAAQAQGIVMADPATADYFVRTYLNAVPEGDGTAVTYVLDVFNSKKQRTQRIEDQVKLNARAAAPWSIVDDRVLAAVAAKSADELAAVMTNTPEAILAASQAKPPEPTSAPRTADAADGRTIVAATPPPVGPPATAAAAAGIGAVALH